MHTHSREREEETVATARVDLYDATYGRFDQPIYQEVRRETWGQDIGQNGWITANEQDMFIEWLSLRPGQRLLDIACGSGGPTLRIAERTGTFAIGVDIHADGISAGRRHAAVRGMADRAAFEIVNAQGVLPFAGETFDVVMCVDAINHLADRPRVLTEWVRVLKPGGRLMFTDPAIVTGPLTNEEISIRSSIGFFLFVAPDTDDRMLAEAGLCLTLKQDLTEALARTATSWHSARAKRAAELTLIEGQSTFEGQQRFLETAARIAREKRLSRFAYVSRKPS